MANKRRRRAVAIPRALDCIKPEHRDGYARYLAARPAFEIEMFLEKLYANDSKRKHFLYSPTSGSAQQDDGAPQTFVDWAANGCAAEEDLDFEDVHHAEGLT